MKSLRSGKHTVPLLIFCMLLIAPSRSHAEPVPSPYFNWLNDTRMVLADTYRELVGIAHAVKSQRIFYENGKYIVAPYWAYPEFARDHKKAIAALAHIQENVIGDHFVFSADDPNADSKEFIADLLDVYLNAMKIAALYIEPLMVDEDQQPRIDNPDYYNILFWIHRGEIALNMALLVARSEATSDLVGGNTYSDTVLLGANTILFSRYFVQSCFIVAHQGGPVEEYENYRRSAIEAFNDSVDLRNDYLEWIKSTFPDDPGVRDAHFEVFDRWDDLLTSTENLMAKLSTKTVADSALGEAEQAEPLMAQPPEWRPDDQEIWDLQLAISGLPELLGRDAGIVPN